MVSGLLGGRAYSYSRGIYLLNLWEVVDLVLWLRMTQVDPKLVHDFLYSNLQGAIFRLVVIVLICSGCTLQEGF